MKEVWKKISFIGLDTSEEFTKREVVLMNKLIFISAVLMLSVIPVEIIINGWDLVWIEFLIVLACLSALLFNYKRKFNFAKYYFFVVASSVIFFLGIGIGKGSANDLFFFPTFIFPAMLFNKRLVILTLSLIAFLLFVLQNYLMDNVEPTIYVKPEIKSTIKYFFYIIVFTIVFFEVYYFKSINLKFQSLLELKNKEIEEKNQEIVDSITYAKRIQEAILLPPYLVKKYLPDSFVLYKPKDIVAGDFYWIEKFDNRLYVAVADCTGHGVPGAMVSVVCNTALNSALREFKLTKPSEILEKARELIVNQFNKNGGDVKDGMDISLACIHDSVNNKIKVEWAGANNPIWFLQKDEIELTEIKADKQAVGKADSFKAFTNHELFFETGTLIYLFSDGFADQFGKREGDTKGKKYKTKTLKKFIESNSNHSMHEQMQKLDTEFESWKSDLEQVDDICIIGVRL